MISIQTNVASLYGQQNFQLNSTAETKTIQHLTSGFRINSSADDAAGLAIANSLRSESVELQQGVANATNGVSQLQIIDGGLSNISQVLDRLKTLATQAASSTFTGDFNTLDKEFQSDLAEINRQATNIGLSTGGQFNAALNVYVGGGIGNNNGAQIGVPVESINLNNATATQAAITASGTYSISVSNTSNTNTASVSSTFGTQAAITSTYCNSVDAYSLGLATGTALTAATFLSITSVADAQVAITAIAAAVVSLGKVQGVVGAGVNQLGFAIGLAQSQITNYAADQGQIRDADIATEASMLTKEQVLSQSSMAALAQANSMPQAVLKLLQ
jgi:flagellin